MNTRWHVAADRTVTAPGGRQWTGAPSQQAAFGLAQSMAGIDRMLATITRQHRVEQFVQRAYGFHRVPRRTAQ